MQSQIVTALFILGLGASAVPAASAAQTSPPRLPFGIGEVMTYHARIGGFGASGTGEMRVEGPVAVRGRDTYLLRFDLDGRIGPMKIEGRTRSWLDPETMASLRYQKQERSPVSRRSEGVELFPEELVWRGDDGREGTLPNSAPLDELSFLYYVRTLPLANGALYSVERHFDERRNPVLVRVVGREHIRVPAGEFAAVVVEMQVQDGHHFDGGGVIRIHLSDDSRRIPLRIESSVKLVGKVVLSLKACNRSVVAAAERD